jgi:cell division protein FtsW
MTASISGRIKAKAALVDPSRYGRSDRSTASRWFWEIDRVLLLLVAVLIGIGLIAVAAASPAAGQRYSGGSVRFNELHYFYRQLIWIAASLPVMIGISMMPRERLRRWSIAGAVMFLILLALVPVLGEEKNGAVRWINIGVGQLQPSEFLKPFFVVALAWLLSLKQGDKSLPVFPLSAALTGVIAILLMRQPDFGSTIIYGCVWIAMLALAGLRMKVLMMLAGAALAGVVIAYFTYDVATVRIDGFLFGEGDNFQVENAMKTLTAGGLFGMGPGGGTRKFGLPEPHTDYIFSVIGEEFGLIACLAIALLYLAIVARVLIKLLDEENGFAILAAAGLAIEFGLQAIINMAVNVQIAPSKGMTLPFISYGGSSMLALSIGMGLLLAFTRRNPYLTRSPYVVKWSGERSEVQPTKTRSKAA